MTKNLRVKVFGQSESSGGIYRLPANHISRYGSLGSNTGNFERCMRCQESAGWNCFVFGVLKSLVFNFCHGFVEERRSSSQGCDSRYYHRRKRAKKILEREVSGEGKIRLSSLHSPLLVVGRRFYIFQHQHQRSDCFDSDISFILFTKYFAATDCSSLIWSEWWEICVLIPGS